MGDVVNLRNFRKQKARQEKERQADANRRLHGQSRHERDVQQGERALAERRLEGHRRDPDEGGDDLQDKNRDKQPDTGRDPCSDA